MKVAGNEKTREKKRNKKKSRVKNERQKVQVQENKFLAKLTDGTSVTHGLYLASRCVSVLFRQVTSCN